MCASFFACSLFLAPLGLLSLTLSPFRSSHLFLLVTSSTSSSHSVLNAIPTPWIWLRNQYTTYNSSSRQSLLKVSLHSFFFIEESITCIVRIKVFWQISLILSWLNSSVIYSTIDNKILIDFSNNSTYRNRNLEEVRCLRYKLARIWIWTQLQLDQQQMLLVARMNDVRRLRPQQQTQVWMVTGSFFWYQLIKLHNIYQWSDNGSLAMVRQSHTGIWFMGLKTYQNYQRWTGPKSPL